MHYTTDRTIRAELLAAFQAADDAWQVELEAAFGKHAGDARYTKAGTGLFDDEINMALRAAYLRRYAASVRWYEASHIG